MANRIADIRPSPDALLEEARTGRRGKLKIFLGAAPGVGKTYEMLTQGRQRRLDGIDAVIGVVETHGRPETDILTKGFEIVPKKRSLYKGRVIFEMDIDAILQRRPALVLVDELAHTNAEGSLHPKRYMDVAEILDAGIDVYSTLNVQHIESLNDVVAQITRIRVRETLPDKVVDHADEIELVDTTSDDLLKRLREGKVYVKAQAERALRHFFSSGNLTALRELALRRAAQHVDRDMVEYMRSHAIGGPWPVTERVLVCINEHASSGELVRRTRRIADNLKAEWTALYVENARHGALSESERDRVTDALRLAQQLGAESLTLPGRHIAEAILGFARTNNVTQIVIAKPERSLWFELIHGSVVRDLIRRSDGINISVISAKEGPPVGKATKTAGLTGTLHGRHYGVSLLALAATTGVAAALGSVLTLGSAGMLFLVPVLVSAVSFGLWPALFTSFVSVMAYNFFFLPPRYTFTIADPNNWLSFAILLFVAIIASNLAARVRTEANLASARAAITGNLYSFAGKLAGIALLDDILWASSFQISSMLKTNVVILLPDSSSGRLAISAGYPPEDDLDAQDMAAAQWSWEKGQPAGRHSETLTGAKRLFLPMRTGVGPVGVIGLQRHNMDSPLSPDERRLLDALINQTALAVERAELAQRVDNARVLAEADRLRVAMLTSLSHDLRTPLASILGAATTLISHFGLYDVARMQELLATIREEAERLDRFVANLLDMSRLEAGVLGTKPQIVDISDVIDAALSRFGRRLADHRVEKDVPPDLPFVKADPVLLEQALVNVLDNAAKYSAPASCIRVAPRAAHGRLTLAVSDEGPGIVPDEAEHIFDKFYRAKAADARVAGTGLGLAVARGFVEAFGGALTAVNRTDRRGAVFTFEIPVATGSEVENGVHTA